MSTTANGGPQRLAALSLVECECCHHRVYFRARSSTPSSDPRWKVEYLYCPVCGHTATQLREVEELPEARAHKQKIRYRYRA